MVLYFHTHHRITNRIKAVSRRLYLVIMKLRVNNTLFPFLCALCVVKKLSFRSATVPSKSGKHYQNIASLLDPVCPRPFNVEYPGPYMTLSE
jgi:hypothetical protein